MSPLSSAASIDCRPASLPGCAASDDGITCAFAALKPAVTINAAQTLFNS
ncbi:hypothetical protein AB4Y96_23160 [Phyllobacterium sp. TAF24]|nr:hypothetical protein [Phyllobacterium sp. OV277]